MKVTLTWVGSCGAEVEADVEVDPGVDCIVGSIVCPDCGGPMRRCDACEGLPGQHICSKVSA